MGRTINFHICDQVYIGVENYKYNTVQYAKHSWSRGSQTVFLIQIKDAQVLEMLLYLSTVYTHTASSLVLLNIDKFDPR